PRSAVVRPLLSCAAFARESRWCPLWLPASLLARLSLAGSLCGRADAPAWLAPLLRSEMLACLPATVVCSHPRRHPGSPYPCLPGVCIAPGSRAPARVPVLRTELTGQAPPGMHKRSLEATDRRAARQARYAPSQGPLSFRLSPGLCLGGQASCRLPER